MKRIGALLAGFLLGWLSLGAIVLGICTARPPEPTLVFRGADGETVTVEDIADGIKPYSHKLIDEELPWGTRWVAHKICDWSIRSHIKIAIAVHGHQISGALKVVEPLSNTLFRPEPAARIRGLRKLCDTPVGELGPVAVQARQDAGPVGVLGRNEGVGAVGAGCPCGATCGETCVNHCGCSKGKD